MRARRLTRAYGDLDPGAGAERHALLSELFSQIGTDAVVEPPLHCDYGWNITLGAGAYKSTPTASSSTARRSR